MGASAAGPIIAGAGLALDAGGRIFGASSGGRQPTVNIAPAAARGLETGVEAATEGLEATPALGSEDVLDMYRQSGERIQGFDIPESRIDPQEMSRRIAETAATVNAPEVARGRREVREAAGVYGPSSATAQAGAAVEAQSQNYIQRLLAELQPQLERERFNEDMQQLNMALGRETALQRTALDPYQVINSIRQGYTGQLLGAGAPASAVPTQYGVPAFGAAAQGIGQTAMQLPMTLALSDYIRNGRSDSNSFLDPDGNPYDDVPR